MCWMRLRSCSSALNWENHFNTDLACHVETGKGQTQTVDTQLGTPLSKISLDAIALIFAFIGNKGGSPKAGKTATDQRYVAGVGVRV